jgi:hypothetical protein
MPASSKWVWSSIPSSVSVNVRASVNVCAVEGLIGVILWDKKVHRIVRLSRVKWDN